MEEAQTGCDCPNGQEGKNVLSERNGTLKAQDETNQGEHGILQHFMKFMHECRVGRTRKRA